MESDRELKWDDSGLVPAVVQDAETGEVLSVAYLNRESLARTRELGETVFYSRSRRQLWHKGETSGNTQKVVGVAADCDRDALLIRVVPRGPACHTGNRSCFFGGVEGFAGGEAAGIGTALRELEQVIAERREKMPEGSYTTKLFQRGLKYSLQKVGEEATETVVAGMAGDRGEMVRETADLVYHLLVALRQMEIDLTDIAAELRSRRK